MGVRVNREPLESRDMTGQVSDDAIERSWVESGITTEQLQLQVKCFFFIFVIKITNCVTLITIQNELNESVVVPLHRN